MSKGTPRRRRLDVTLFIGLGIAVGFIVLGHVVEGGSVSSLAQGAAALIVFGGTCGAVLVSFGAAEVLRAVRSLRQLVVDDERPAENLSDPAKLGSGIAVAFVATVYGVGSANLLFLPLGTKLRGLLGVADTATTRRLKGRAA